MTRPRLNLKFILPLSLFYLTIYLSADAIAYKMTILDGVIEPGPTLIFPLSYTIGAIISEVYGSGISKKLIWLTLFFQLLFAFIIKIIIGLPSINEVANNNAYILLFNNIINFVLSGTVATLISSFVNIYLVAKTKILLNGKYYCLRNIFSTAVGGFLSVFIMITFIFVPELGIKKSVNLFLCIYTLELLYTTILSFPSWFFFGILKKYENLDVYDYDVKFNPFKFNGVKQNVKI